MESIRTIDYLLVGAGGLILFLFGVLWQALSSKVASLTTDVKENREKIADFKNEVAKEYISRESMRDMLEPIMEELRKIDKKLDGKADK